MGREEQLFLPELNFLFLKLFEKIKYLEKTEDFTSVVFPISLLIRFLLLLDVN